MVHSSSTPPKSSTKFILHQFLLQKHRNKILRIFTHIVIYNYIYTDYIYTAFIYIHRLYIYIRVYQKLQNCDDGCKKIVPQAPQCPSLDHGAKGELGLVNGYRKMVLQHGSTTKNVGLTSENGGWATKNGGLSTRNWITLRSN